MSVNKFSEWRIVEYDSNGRVATAQSLWYPDAVEYLNGLISSYEQRTGDSIRSILPEEELLDMANIDILKKKLNINLFRTQPVLTNY